MALTFQPTNGYMVILPCMEEERTTESGIITSVLHASCHGTNISYGEVVSLDTNIYNDYNILEEYKVSNDKYKVKIYYNTKAKKDIVLDNIDYDLINIKDVYGVVYESIK